LHRKREARPLADFPRPVARSERGAYCGIDIAQELRQSEIISNLTFYKSSRRSDGSGLVDNLTLLVSHAIILTPDCDLLQDFKKRTPLFSVLMFGIEDAIQLKAKLQFHAKEWKHIVNNELERFYFLTAIDDKIDARGVGIPDCVVDFKRYFTLSPEEIYRQVSLDNGDRAHRRCRLTDLWREDLQRRAMSYMQRVGLEDASD
jgi:hypothetical protein